MFNFLRLTFVFLYHFLFIDQQTGHVSHTKFFSIIGYGLWCWLFPYAVIHGSQAQMDLWLVFGAVVIGNRSLNVWMQGKAGIPNDPGSTFKAVQRDGKQGPVIPDVGDLVDK